MKKEKAIQILNGQIDKLNQRGAKVDTPWVNQTSSYIKDFFGKDSDEYKYITSPSFRPVPMFLPDDWTQTEANWRLIAINFLNNCIESIKNKGLYRNPFSFILKMKTEVILFIITLIFSGLGWLGTFIYNKGYEKAKNESIRTAPESITVTPQEPNSDSAGVNDSNKKEPRNHSDSSKKIN